MAYEDIQTTIMTLLSFAGGITVIVGAISGVIKLIDYIAALSSIGAKIKTIEIEPNFNNIKPDAYITFVFDKKLFHQLIEIELRHDYVDVNRFKPVLGYILQKTNNVRPTIIIIQDTNKDYNTDNFTGLQVIQLNTKLREIAKVININR